MIPAPIRLCCGERHAGVRCNDGMVMCCMCFERFPVEELSFDSEGRRWDVCKPCNEHDLRGLLFLNIRWLLGHRR